MQITVVYATIKIEFYPQQSLLDIVSANINPVDGKIGLDDLLRLDDRNKIKSVNPQVGL